MNKFVKYIIVSMLLTLFAFILVINVEDWARFSGEMNKNILLLESLFVFALLFLSILFLFKANFEREKVKMIITSFISLCPLTVFIMNGLIFTVWFVGK